MSFKPGKKISNIISVFGGNLSTMPWNYMWFVVLILWTTCIEEIWNNPDCLDLESNTCNFNTTDESLFCNGVYEPFEHSVETRSLTICNYPTNIFDVTSVLEYFPFLESFTLTSSNVSYVRGRFPPNTSLKIYDEIGACELNIGNVLEVSLEGQEGVEQVVLNITDLVIEKIRSNVFSALNNLRIFDLRGNRLNHLHPNVINLVNRLDKLYLRGNAWNCAKNLDWVLYLNATIVQDMEMLKCFGQPYSDKPLKPIATLISNLRVECPDPCECMMVHIVSVPEDKGGGLLPVIQVNCSGKGLKKFPEILPQNTTTILLQNNRIRTFESLINNKFYRGVSDIYLDNNLLTNMDDLEGSYWLSHFRVFSLRGNNLTNIPTYAFDNALQKNHNAAQIFLSKNPWRCDCLFTPSFQDLLAKYEGLVKDKMNVTCNQVQGDENSNQPIIKLSRSAICRLPPENSVHALDLLNALLASLIVLIFGKLAYDYYIFKRTGQLPWIVTKMP